MEKTELLNTISTNEYDYYGLRADDYKYNVGDICNNSHELYQDPMFDDEGELVYPEGEGIYKGLYDAGELDGTSTIQITENNIDDAFNLINRYFGDVYLVAGDYANGGNDAGEIIIKDATVLAVIDERLIQVA